MWHQTFTACFLWPNQCEIKLSQYVQNIWKLKSNLLIFKLFILCFIVFVKWNTQKARERGSETIIIQKRKKTALNGSSQDLTAAINWNKTTLLSTYLSNCHCCISPSLSFFILSVFPPIPGARSSAFPLRKSTTKPRERSLPGRSTWPIKTMSFKPI